MTGVVMLAAWLLLGALDAEQCTVVWNDKRVPSRVAPEQLGALETGEVLDVWSWSYVRSARRSALGAPTSERRGPFVGEAEAELQLLGDVASAHLLSAPVAMWDRVPEDLLPRRPVVLGRPITLRHARGETLRVRALAPEAGFGSFWHEVTAGRRLDLALREAPVIGLIIVGDRRRVIADAQLAVHLEGPTGAGERQAVYASDARGVVRMPNLPDARRVAILATAPHHLPATSSALPSELPTQLLLGRGRTVSGRLIDSGGRPVSGALVFGEAFLGPAAGTSVLRTMSEADGRFNVAPLPAEQVLVGLGKIGFAVERREIDLGEGDVDLGDVVLVPGARLTLRVTDPDGTPVTGATVTIPLRKPALTDAEGLVVFEHANTSGSLEVRAEADGFAARSERIHPPFEREESLELIPAFTVTGTVENDSGEAPGGTTVLIRSGRRGDSREIPDDGAFRLTLEPEREAVLVFLSPTTRSLVVPLQPGERGAVLDLGTVVLERGGVLTGRIERADDGRPVVGARIFTLRDTPLGNRMTAWLRGEVLETSSAGDGVFRLTGLATGPVEVNIEAPGLAPVRRTINVPEALARVDMGTVVLESGSTLVVVADGFSATGATARVDPVGRWREADMRTRPMAGDRARFKHLAPGRAIVTIVRGYELLCETQTMLAAEDSVEVLCAHQGIQVAGQVSVAGHAEGPGTVVFSPVAGAKQAEHAILTTETLGGLSTQRMFGMGRPPVEVAVADDGSYATDALRVGQWDVSWIPRAGSLSESKRIKIPDAEAYRLDLDFPGGSIAGIVVDGEGRPVPGARIDEAVSKSVDFTDAEGQFKLTGLRGGERFVRARLGDQESAVVRVDLAADPHASGIELLLGSEGPETLSVLVRGEGSPIPGALVFADFGTGSFTTSTTNGEGRAQIVIEPPKPQRWRVAAFANGRWAFGPWQAVDAENAPAYVLAHGAAGGLHIVSEIAGEVAIVNQNGWEVSALLRRLGILPRVAAAGELSIGGLPPGTYRLGLDGQSQMATVPEGDTATARFAVRGR